MALTALVIFCLLASGCTGPSSSPVPEQSAAPVVSTAHTTVQTPLSETTSTLILTTATEVTPQPTVGVIIKLPADAESVATFVKGRVYETPVSIYGEAGAIGELNCPCFTVTDKAASVRIWYDMMVLPDGKTEPAVSILGLKNGNTVLVTGVVKSGENGGTRNDFWASSITKVVG